MGSPIKVVTVNTSNKSYEIFIGNSILSQLKKNSNILSAERYGVIVSSKIFELYEDLIISFLKDYSPYNIFLMKDGEENKNYSYAQEFLDGLLIKGFSRKSAIIGIGGGVVGDFSGFIAALYMRGIPIIHIPTTLLSMVDSSIGGKVAVNISSGKNIVGAFYQPEMVISDISFIKTLPDHEFKNGLTEALKHAIIGEEKLLDILLENDLKSIKDYNSIKKIVYLSALFKSKVVEKDEKEGGLRAILNFGHTAGHAIESLLEFKKISHGEAVAIGIKIEMEISRRLGLLAEHEIDLVNELINRYELIYNEYQLKNDEIIKHMQYDKKNQGGKIKFVLLKELNNPVYDCEVDMNILKESFQSI